MDVYNFERKFLDKYLVHIDIQISCDLNVSASGV